MPASNLRFSPEGQRCSSAGGSAARALFLLLAFAPVPNAQGEGSRNSDALREGTVQEEHVESTVTYLPGRPQAR